MVALQIRMANQSFLSNLQQEAKEEMQRTANVEPIMKEAIDLLDAKTKKDYLEALDVAPGLVAKESDSAKFLRIENNNPYAAARRLAMYWKFRRECHGDDRWLRPMTATGGGVLDDAEVALLRTGIYHYSHTPGYGPVLVVDGSRNKHCTTESVEKVLFYLGTVMEDPAVQTEGVSVVYAVTSDDTETRIGDRFGLYAALGLPVKVKRFLAVQNYEPGKESLLEFLAVRRKLQSDMSYKSNCQLIASNKSRGHLLSTVESIGIPWKVLPKSCGGRVDEDVICDWLRQRMSLEDCLPPNTTASMCIQMVPPVATSAAAAYQSLVVRTAKRKVDTPQDFEQKVERLRAANHALRADNRKLEELLLQARKIALEQQMFAMTGGTPVAAVGPPPPRTPTFNRRQVAMPVAGPVRPPAVVAEDNCDDYLFGVPVADPFEQMRDTGEMSSFVQLRRR